MNVVKRVLVWLQKPKVEIRFPAFVFLPVQTFGVILGTYTGNKVLTAYAACWAGWTIYVLIRHHRDGGKL